MSARQRATPDMTNTPVQIVTRWYINRPSGVCVPLIPADELPGAVDLSGIPRQIHPSDVDGMQLLGTLEGPVLNHRASRKGVSTFKAEGGAQTSNPAHSTTRSSGVVAQKGGRSERQRSQTQGQVLSRDQVQASAPHMNGNFVVPQNGAHRKNVRAANPPASKTRSRPSSKQVANFSSQNGMAVGTIQRPLPPSGKEPDTSKKEYCSYWIRKGECDYTQTGCYYKHVMPDLRTLINIGFRGVPKWYREKQLAEGRAVERREERRATVQNRPKALQNSAPQKQLRWTPADSSSTTTTNSSGPNAQIATMSGANPDAGVETQQSLGAIGSERAAIAMPSENRILPGSGACITHPQTKIAYGLEESKYAPLKMAQSTSSTSGSSSKPVHNAKAEESLIDLDDEEYPSLSSAIAKTTKVAEHQRPGASTAVSTGRAKSLSSAPTGSSPQAGQPPALNTPTPTSSPSGSSSQVLQGTPAIIIENVPASITSSSVQIRDHLPSSSMEGEVRTYGHVAGEGQDIPRLAPPGTKPVPVNFRGRTKRPRPSRRQRELYHLRREAERAEQAALAEVLEDEYDEA